MAFDDLINKAKSLAAGSDGKLDSSDYKAYAADAQDAYTEFNKKDGTFADHAKSAYSEIQTNHKAGGSSTTEAPKKEESK
ncbi:hypothetical protein CAAN1_09S03554 [[Candida] anglica]|uniref:Uncharacterized protein n=1 Tax=[Candida] anglica TaxID=148631 RepID=A0ABP0EF06_9ASCO